MSDDLYNAYQTMDEKLKSFGQTRSAAVRRGTSSFRPGRALHNLPEAWYVDAVCGLLTAAAVVWMMLNWPYVVMGVLSNVPTVILLLVAFGVGAFLLNRVRRRLHRMMH